MTAAGAAPDPSGGRRPRSFARRLLGGLAAGIATGLFFGESTGILEPVADGFVKLLQMAVLPYVTVSLVAGIGGLKREHLRVLGVRAALVLLGLWTLALGAAFLMPLTFPRTEGASFFSTTLLERAPPLALVDLYIPSNPFFALANNIVPAVVLFSILSGVALMAVPHKERLLSVLETAGEMFSGVMRLVTRLTPYGLFAIAAATAGTMRLEQAERLQVYLVAYSALAIVLALWLLPGLIGALTPIPLRAVLSRTGEALITATIAGDLFIVLPLLVDACKELVRQFGSADREAGTLTDIIIPMSYNFPHSGKLLSVSFVLFAGWFSDAPVHLSDYPRLALTSLLTLFGSINAAMPFLLDAFHVPRDTFQLFIASGVVNSRTGTLVAAMHTVTVALLGTCAVTGLVRWRPAAIARYAAVSLALLAVMTGTLRATATGMVGGAGHTADVLDAMRLMRRAEATVLPAALPAADPAPPGRRLEAIVTRRVLRVCYPFDGLPFAFTNASGELVGYDVEFMHHLAGELGVRLEFAPVDRADFPAGVEAMLLDGRCDVVIGGVVVTTRRARMMQLSNTYMTETLAFIVPDEDRERFETWDAIRARGALTIATAPVPYYLQKLKEELPQATITTVDRLADLFAPATHADAIALTAERGSAWTLRFPRYSAVVPGPAPIQIPLTIATPLGEPGLATVVDTWIDLKQRDGTLDGLYQYWILGRERTAPAPRWSIVRDVLHWVK